MARSLPSALDAARILAAKRTRPLRRPPPSAGRALAPALKALRSRFGPNVEGLQARWPEIVGAALAGRTEPVKLTRPRTGEGAALEIRVAGPSAALIQHQAPDVLERVNLFLGSGAVARLRIVQGPLRGAPARGARPAPRVRRTRGPLDAAAEEALGQSLAALADGPLKKALARLGREVLRSS
ncbi:MAG: DciA family protein [Caulobacteraceae bacterium]